MLPTLAQVLEWLFWGFFMGVGWALGTWLVSKVLK